MAEPFFTEVEAPIRYEGPDSDNALAFQWYDADRVVAGRRMEDHLRFAVCYWHSFAWDGFDIFGAGTLDRPWHPSFAGSTAPIAAAHRKMDAAFEFFTKLGVPFYCFHDRDIAPEGASFKESAALLDEMVDAAAEHQERTGVVPLWGTANLFSNPRYQAGASTNPDPEVFAYAAAQVAHCLEATHRLGGENYVLWGGREGYETLLNTDMRRELDQLGRFLSMVVEHKHRIGFTGTILIEPKPFEPTKHQYDFDVAAVWAFLQRYDLVDEVQVNIEVNHATLAGHDFAHEIAVAVGAGIFGSVDANAGDDRLGWDVDRFPVSVEQMTLGDAARSCAAAGSARGGFNFDAKLRRQSIDRTDLFHAHIGGMDTLARALLAAASILESGELDRRARPALRRLGRRAGSLDPRRHRVPRLAPRASRRDRGAHPRVGAPGGAGEPGRPPHRARPLTRRGHIGRRARRGRRLLDHRHEGRGARARQRADRRTRLRAPPANAPAEIRAGPGRVVGSVRVGVAAGRRAGGGGHQRRRAAARDGGARRAARRHPAGQALERHRVSARCRVADRPASRWEQGVGRRMRRGAGGEHHDHQAVVAAPRRT